MTFLSHGCGEPSMALQSVRENRGVGSGPVAVGGGVFHDDDRA
jgi:hypothetical protein